MKDVPQVLHHHQDTPSTPLRRISSSITSARGGGIETGTENAPGNKTKTSKMTSIQRNCVFEKGGRCREYVDGAKRYWRPVIITKTVVGLPMEGIFVFGD